MSKSIKELPSIFSFSGWQKLSPETLPRGPVWIALEREIADHGEDDRGNTVALPTRQTEIKICLCNYIAHDFDDVYYYDLVPGQDVPPFEELSIIAVMSAINSNWVSQKFVHVFTGGIYDVVCEAKMESDQTLVTVYSNSVTGEKWVRPSSEFHSGRFKPFSSTISIDKD